MSYVKIQNNIISTFGIKFVIYNENAGILEIHYTDQDSCDLKITKETVESAVQSIMEYLE